MLAWVWREGDNYITHRQIVKASQTTIISIQWMFEGDTKVSYLTWDNNHDDKKMLEQFSNIMQNVRVAVSQNGKKFDHKILQWRLCYHKLQPLRNVQIFDILQLSRQNFRPPSHKLDSRSQTYGFGGKIRMEFEDWIDVIENKSGALQKMVKYGCKDITDLRRIFWRELPYYNTLPISLAALAGLSRDHCQKCASRKQCKYDIYPTKIDNKLMMKCNNCGYLWKEARKR